MEKMLAAREIILEILEILLLLQTISIAEDRPPRYGEWTDVRAEDKTSHYVQRFPST